MKKQKNILVAPLNWGLGHATRCVPIIRLLQQEGANVIIGGDGMALNYLQKEFPELKSVFIPDLKVKYPKSGGYMLYFALRLPQLYTHVKKENAYLKKLARDLMLDGIISDNRYGLFHRRIPCVIITHQLYIKTPAFKRTVRSIVKKMISRFTATWVPDIKGNDNLSGKLSHSEKQNSAIKFVGTLSRFSQNENTSDLKNKIIAVLSGPEPHRTQLENTLTQQLLASNYSAHLVKGLVQKSIITESISKNLQVTNYLQSKALQQEIEQAEIVIARAGYSTIMDLVTLGKKAILIPTPGQTEQEYLAHHLKSNSQFVFCKEGELDIEKAIFELDKKRPKNTLSHQFNIAELKTFLASC